MSFVLVIAAALSAPARRLDTLTGSMEWLAHCHENSCRVPADWSKIIAPGWALADSESTDAQSCANWCLKSKDCTYCAGQHGGHWWFPVKLERNQHDPDGSWWKADCDSTPGNPCNPRVSVMRKTMDYNGNEGCPFSVAGKEVWRDNQCQTGLPGSSCHETNDCLIPVGLSHPVCRGGWCSDGGSGKECGTSSDCIPPEGRTRGVCIAETETDLYTGRVSKPKCRDGTSGAPCHKHGDCISSLSCQYPLDAGDGASSRHCTKPYVRI